MALLAHEIAAEISAWPGVVSIAQGGSHATGKADAHSDIDLYVYARSEAPVDRRRQLAIARSDRFELDNRTWETGDEWIERVAGTPVDIMYRHCGWIEDRLDAVLVRFEANTGYTTCLWHNVLTSLTLFDREGWFADLQARAAQPYPEQLARNIIRKNYPLLRKRQSSFAHQILRAAGRGDVVAVNHRVTAFLASCFDVLFAANRVPHPGEKRLLLFSSSLTHVPKDLNTDTAALIRAGAQLDQAGIQSGITRLVDNLDRVLANTGDIAASQA
jgi:hypothetical protein